MAYSQKMSRKNSDHFSNDPVYGFKIYKERKNAKQNF